MERSDAGEFEEERSLNHLAAEGLLLLRYAAKKQKAGNLAATDL